MSVADERVRHASSTGKIVFEDSADHFHNALLRLLNLDEREFAEWIDRAGRADGELLEQLASAWRELRPMDALAAAPHPGSLPSRRCDPEGSVLHDAIAESPEFGIAVSPDASIGWLMQCDEERSWRVLDPPVYEHDYFEGDNLQAGGYGSYSDQAGWRLEKAARQVREMVAATGLTQGRVLDIGCGYGYFRVALGQAGYEHDGLEVSEHARRVARDQYGFDTFDGEIEDHWREWNERYDAITGFDFVEHVPHVDELFTQVLHCLKPGGFFGLKTPNLRCPEADVFGAHYHSFKREHLWYFTPESLTAAAVRAGFDVVDVSTTSHLLVGFVGAGTVAQWATAGLGADITAWYRKPPAAA